MSLLPGGLLNGIGETVMPIVAPSPADADAGTIDGASGKGFLAFLKGCAKTLESLPAAAVQGAPQPDVSVGNQEHHLTSPNAVDAGKSEPSVLQPPVILPLLPRSVAARMLRNGVDSETPANGDAAQRKSKEDELKTDEMNTILPLLGVVMLTRNDALVRGPLLPPALHPDAVLSTASEAGTPPETKTDLHASAMPKTDADNPDADVAKDAVSSPGQHLHDSPTAVGMAAGSVSMAGTAFGSAESSAPGMNAAGQGNPVPGIAGSPGGVPLQLPAGFAAASTSDTAPVFALSHHLLQPGWTEDVAERLIWMQRAELKTAHLRLDPPHLGEIEVRITLHEAGTEVWFSAPSASVRDALESALPRLRELFSQNGLQLGQAGIFSGGGGGNAAPFRQPDRFPHRSRSVDHFSPQVVERGLPRHGGLFEDYA